MGSVTTDADGNYTLNVSYTGPVAVVVTGGSYTDEATGATVTLETGDELVTFLDSAENGESVAITALTTIAAEQAAANAASGIETAINAANKAVAEAFGLTGVDLSSIIPADPTNTVSAGASVASQAYGIVMAALTQFVDEAGGNASDVLDLIQDLADDYSDGVLDGYNAAGEAINSATGLASLGCHDRIEYSNNKLSEWFPQQDRVNCFPKFVIGYLQNTPSFHLRGRLENISDGLFSIKASFRKDKEFSQPSRKEQLPSLLFPTAKANREKRYL